jgi:hypothetical protein
VQKHHDLAQLIQAWPELPEDTKAAIKALVSDAQGTEQEK